jgi:uncharacterized radical SAM superfamily protein
MYIPELFEYFLIDIRLKIQEYYEYDTYLLVEVEKDGVKKEFKCITLDNFEDNIKPIYDNFVMLFNCPIEFMENEHYYVFNEDNIKIVFKLFIGGY